MTNNTIPNVPRELLADLLGNDHDKRIMAERHLLAMLANAPSPAGVDGLEVIGWYTDDHLDDKSATTYSWAVAERWVEKGWPVSPLYAAPVSDAKAQCVVMPERETSTPSSKWASAGEPDPHGKTYDCERAELSMGEYTDDELANAVFMHDHRSFDIAATMRGEPGSIVLLTAAKERIRWLSRSLDKALARLNTAPVQQVSVPDVSAMARILADRNADARQ